MTYKNSIEMLREYAELVKEAEGFEDENQTGNDEFNDENSSLDDTSMDNTSEESQLNDSDMDDPVTNLASELASATGHDETRILSTIQQFLKNRSFEIVPLNGLADQSGNV